MNELNSFQGVLPGRGKSISSDHPSVKTPQIILCGQPGIGKWALIKKLPPDAIVLDVKATNNLSNYEELMRKEFKPCPISFDELYLIKPPVKKSKRKVS